MLLKNEIEKAASWQGPRWSGRVTQAIGLLIESIGPKTSLGELCIVVGKKGRRIPCQVVGFKERKVLLMPFTDALEISPGSEVFPEEITPGIAVSSALLGRVIDPFGHPLDGKGKIPREAFYPLINKPPSPLDRKNIETPFVTGIRAIDALLTLGKGQRLGIFSSAGVGKSSLVGMIATHAKADVNVIALIGERGREVGEFLKKHKKILSRSVVIVATSDTPALFRSMGAFAATAIAEYFRDKGKEVVLMMDSISRFAFARREIGLAIGEPPTTRGYTPSVFSLLPQLLERAGNSKEGSITAFYTILTEGEEWEDPIALQMRSLVDGHLFLSQELSSLSHYPPIDIPRSLSRVMREVVGDQHQRLAAASRKEIALIKEAQDILSLGAYVKGAHHAMDLALEKREIYRQFLQQEEKDASLFADTLEQLRKIIHGKI